VVWQGRQATAAPYADQVGFSVVNCKCPINWLLVRSPTVKPVSRIAEEFHLVSNSYKSSTEYRCKFSLKSALQYEIAFNLTKMRKPASSRAIKVNPRNNGR
jgi:hypothetical protein